MFGIVASKEGYLEGQGIQLVLVNGAPFRKPVILMDVGWWVNKKFYGVNVTMKPCGQITSIIYSNGGLFTEDIGDENYLCKG